MPLASRQHSARGTFFHLHRTGGNSLKGRVRSDIRRNFFMEGMVRLWELVKSPSLEKFKENSVLWAGDKVRISHRLDLIILDIFSSLSDSGTLGFSAWTWEGF